MEERISVYVSYSGRNTEATLQVMEAILGAGYGLVCDCMLPMHQPFSERVSRAIGQAALVVAVITDDAMTCEYMDAELDYTWESGRRLLSVVVGDASLPPKHRAALEKRVMCSVSENPAPHEIAAVMTAVKQSLEDKI